MEKANLFWFLDGISKNEFNRFGDFLRSPFFKIPHRIVKLYEFIESMFSLLQTKPLTKELLSEHFYPGKSFDENQLNIRKLISDFRICFEHYLTQKELEESKFEQKLFLLRQLRKAQAAGEYYKTLEEAKKLADGFETKDEDYYRMMLELIKEQYLFEGYSYKKYSDDLSFDISKQLDLYFIALKLFLIQRIEVREIALTTDEIIMPKFYENVFKEVEENLDYYKLHPDIYCRYLMLQMNKNPDRNHLHQGYISYLNYADEVLKVNCYSYYLDLLYHLQRFVNNGKTEYEKKIIEYAEIMEKKEMFQKYGISNSDIKIIYESAIGVGKYKWAEDFIERNINNIDFLHRDSIYNFGLAKIFFFQKNYSASRKHLIKVPYEDFVHYVDAKLIEARIDYEERCFVEIFGIIDSVKKYLKSHKEISDLYKQTYLTFANFLSRLVKLYEASETLSTIDYDIKKLKDDIDSYPKLLYGDSWLKEKIKEIEKGRH